MLDVETIADAKIRKLIYEYGNRALRLYYDDRTQTAAQLSKRIRKGE